MPHTFHETALAEGLVGRPPWSARVPPDPLFAPSSNTMPDAAGRPGGRPRAGAAAPPFLPVCGHGKGCGIRLAGVPFGSGGLVTRLERRLAGYPLGRAQLDKLPHNGT